jgi:hypothetical protein
MKQIKEKAEKHLRENNLTQYEYKSYIEGAGFGANYVLDEIEKLTNNQNWCAFPKQSHKELKELFEQLKK